MLVKRVSVRCRGRAEERDSVVEQTQSVVRFGTALWRLMAKHKSESANPEPAATGSGLLCGRPVVKAWSPPGPFLLACSHKKTRNQRGNVGTNLAPALGQVLFLYTENLSAT
ncbi:hypothetical protein WMY93_031283 [Mugilogobius chulae]|uniref:Uncharacterized protein n=1 Tax=Mugilogobius chulae TaxID=88201 RepID=A0AAW0MDP1_9GOBI